MAKPRLLDLFCCAGGASMGYARAGFEVVGVDSVFQPRYPFPFMQADALTFPLDGFDVVHASPPCQGYSVTAHLWKKEHPDLVPVMRARLQAWGGLWMMENVPGAPMHHGVVLCGTMFGLNVFRHRTFESSMLLFAPGPCRHTGQVKRWRQKTGTYISVVGHDFRRDEARQAMGIEWMLNKELSQALPPVYTQYLGQQVREVYL
jgi:DNA (cytosine-5)-methyltransferase 1